jgi:nitrogen fixation/metabolism regulation signal transduction histidine kinase
LPITVMALFSYTFLNRSLEKWFGGFPQDIVVEARRAEEADERRARASFDETANSVALITRVTWTQSAQAAPFAPRVTTLSGAPLADPPFPPLSLLDLRSIAQQADLDLLLVTSADGEVLARGGAVDLPLTEVLTQQFASNNPLPERLSIYDMTLDVTRLPLDGVSQFVIVAREHKPNEHLRELVQASERFEQLRSSQRWVRGLGLTTLALLTLLLLFASTWTANHLARSIVMPIRKLAEASDEIARGNLAHRVSEIADDELAALAASFNTMTAELEENRARIETGAQELNAKNLALEERRAYIETVLATVSTGVVSLDEHDRVTTINLAARLMLQPTGGENPTRQETDLPIALAEIACVEDAATLERVVRRARRAGRATEQTNLVRASMAIESESGSIELVNSNGAMATIPVALSVTALRAADESDELSERRGVVLVMEDLTELIAAQRAAAWSEVARRMAHEIKNPLTPIQLSAERIARQFKIQPKLEAKNESVDDATINEDIVLDLPSETVADARLRRIVEEGTETITREVASLKGMVDEFSRFAQFPSAQPAPGDLNEILRQAIALYEERLDGLRLDTRLAPTLPVAFFDYEQMRRVFVNLLENATESVAAAMLADAEGERRITLATAYDARRGVILAEVADNGHGINPGDYPRLFQPYFSTRNRGTGLGLAIVHRIITDHGGRITVEPNYPQGARFRVELPIADEVENQKSKIENQRVDAPDAAATR